MPSFIGPQELVIVFVVILLVMGPKKLPELARSMGSGIREFKHGMNVDHQDADDEDADPSPAVDLPPAAPAPAGVVAATALPPAAPPPAAPAAAPAATPAGQTGAAPAVPAGTPR